MTHTARCCCQDAAITVEGQPVINAICNCASCKRRTGSAFGWSAYFPDAAIIEKSGEMRVYERASDNPYQRFFCVRCGTTLYWKTQNFMPEFIGIAGGCFEEDTLPAPVFSAHDSTRCAWVALPDTCRKMG